MLLSYSMQLPASTQQEGHARTNVYTLEHLTSGKLLLYVSEMLKLEFFPFDAYALAMFFRLGVRVSVPGVFGVSYSSIHVQICVGLK